MGPTLLKKSLILIKNYEIVNKNIKGVKSEKVKIKTWFWNKDLSSLDSIIKKHTRENTWNISRKYIWNI